jgi:hypothetical protein
MACWHHPTFGYFECRAIADSDADGPGAIRQVPRGRDSEVREYLGGMTMANGFGLTMSTVC